jgi:hypothetical protein
VVMELQCCNRFGRWGIGHLFPEQKGRGGGEAAVFGEGRGRGGLEAGRARRRLALEAAQLGVSSDDAVHVGMKGMWWWWAEPGPAGGSKG